MAYYVGNQRVDSIDQLDPALVARVRRRMAVDGGEWSNPNDLQHVLSKAEQIGGSFMFYPTAAPTPKAAPTPTAAAIAPEAVPDSTKPAPETQTTYAPVTAPNPVDQSSIPARHPDGSLVIRASTSNGTTRYFNTLGEEVEGPPAGTGGTGSTGTVSTMPVQPTLTNDNGTASNNDSGSGGSMNIQLPDDRLIGMDQLSYIIDQMGLDAGTLADVLDDQRLDRSEYETLGLSPDLFTGDLREMGETFYTTESYPELFTPANPILGSSIGTDELSPEDRVTVGGDVGGYDNLLSLENSGDTTGGLANDGSDQNIVMVDGRPVDVDMFKAAFGSTENDENWQPGWDVDGSGTIDMADFLRIGESNPNDIPGQDQPTDQQIIDAGGGFFQGDASDEDLQSLDTALGAHGGGVSGQGNNDDPDLLGNDGSTGDPPATYDYSTFDPLADPPAIVDDTGVLRDALMNMILGNTGAIDMLGSEYVNAIGAPNPYSAGKGSILDELEGMLKRSSDKEMENIVNRYSATNKLGSGSFRGALTDQMNKGYLDQLAQARIGFGMKEAETSEDMRSNRLADLRNFTQQIIDNLSGGLDQAQAIKANDIGIQQGVFNANNQNFYDFLNSQQGADAWTQYQEDVGLDMYAKGQGGNTQQNSMLQGATQGLGNILNQPQSNPWGNLASAIASYQYSRPPKGT